MDNIKYRYDIKAPLVGATPDQIANGSAYITIASPDTPEGAAECIRILCAHPAAAADHIRVEVRRIP